MSLRARGPPLRRQQLRIERRCELACVLSLTGWHMGAEHTGLVMRKCDEALRESVAWVVSSPPLEGSETIGARSELSIGLCPRAYRCCRSRSTTSCPKKPNGLERARGSTRASARPYEVTRESALERSSRACKTRELAWPSAQAPLLRHRCIGAIGLIEGRRFGPRTHCYLSRVARHVVVLAEPERSLSGNRRRAKKVRRRKRQRRLSFITSCRRQHARGACAPRSAV